MMVMALLCSCQTGYHDRKPLQTAVPANREDARRIDRVLARLLPCVPRNTCRQYGIIPSAVPNASIDSRGTLRLTTGLLEFAGTDDLLAFALAHEFGHAVLRHPQRHLRNRWLQFIVTSAALWAAHEWMDSKSGAAFTGAGVFLSTSLFGTLPDTRRMEKEADKAAKDIIIRAGYSPDAGAEFWRRYARARPDHPPPRWLSPHPPDEMRAHLLMP